VLSINPVIKLSKRIIFTCLLLHQIFLLNGQCLPNDPDFDNDGICDTEDSCPNFDNNYDLDDDGIPYCLDNCIDIDEDNICDDVDANVDYSKLAIHFSIKRGYYNSTFNLTLFSDYANAQIKYTTNNSKPTTANGITYSNPITISSTTTIKAIAINNTTGEVTQVEAHSYIFLQNIINAPSASAHIKNDPRYNNQIQDAFKALPVISISTNNISPGVNSYTEVESTTEMFFPDLSRKGFMISNGYETWGGSPLNPKKNIRIVFKAQYDGHKKLKYDVFEKDNYDDTEYNIKPTEKFDKLLLRAGSQDGLNGEYAYEPNAQFLRNRYLFDLSIKMNQVAPHGRYVHVFMNNNYLGQYHLLERPDEPFFEAYFGDDKENYEIRKSGVYINGTGATYNQLNNKINLSSSAAIQSTNQYIDLQSAAKFYLMMNFASGYDWAADYNSWCGGNMNPGNGGYQFLLWDVDLSLGNEGFWGTQYSGNENYFALPGNFGQLPSNLIGNIEFQYMVADLAECECYNDGNLTLNNVVSDYMHRADQINTSLIAESLYWGNYYFPFANINNPYFSNNTNNWNVIDHWEVERDRLVNSFFPARLNNLINHLKATNYMSNLEGPTFSQFGGLLANGNDLVLTNPNGNGTIYYTIDGSDPRLIGGGINPNAQIYTGPISLNNGKVIIKARVLNTSISGNTIDKWSGVCPRIFYAGQNYENIVINEIHYNPNDSIYYNNTIAMNDTIDSKNFEFIEIKNLGTSTVNLVDCRFSKGVDLTFENDLLIEPDSFLVFAEDAFWFEQKYGFAPDGVFEGKLDNGGEKINIKNPLGDFIDSLSYDDNGIWDPIPDNGEYSLAYIPGSANNNDPANWAAQKVFVTPSTENSFCAGIIAANETIANISCNGTNDGFISLNPVNGTLPYAYQWSNGSNTSLIIDLAPGNYSVTISDKYNCNQTFTYTITEPTAIQLSSSYVDETYSGTNDGTANVAVSGGTIPYTYNWSNGASTPSINNLAPGNYSVEVVDANGCVITENFIIQASTVCVPNLVQNTQPVIASGLYQVASFIESDGRVDNGNNVSFKAGQYIELTNDFEVELGTEFEVMIEGCE